MAVTLATPSAAVAVPNLAPTRSSAIGNPANTKNSATAAAAAAVPAEMETETETETEMVDLAFALQAPSGGRLPAQYRPRLAQALMQGLPGLADAPGTGVHRLTVAREDTGQPLLPQRARLVLRLPRTLVSDAQVLQGRLLDLQGYTLRLGALQERALLPWGTLYAHLVASDAPDEARFMQQVLAELQQLRLACRPICGRHQGPDSGAPQGYSLMLDGLNAADSLRLLALGIGPHRMLGCGLFVPHRSAAAVGAPS